MTSPRVEVRKQVVAFATAAHAGQVRKFSGDPYITHPIRVGLAAERLAKKHHWPCEILVFCAGVLHDVLEDTPRTARDIDAVLTASANPAWRDSVILVVKELTDTETGNRKTRKAAVCARLRTATTQAKLVKACDIIDNIRDLHKERAEYVIQSTAEVMLLTDAILDGMSARRIWEGAVVEACQMIYKKLGVYRPL